MKSIVKLVTCAAAVGVLTGTVHAASGVQIVTKTTSSGGAPQGRAESVMGDRTTQIQIESTRMRTEATDAKGEKNVMLFDGTKQVLDIVYVGKKTYTEMTKEDVDKMGAQMTDMMAQMQKRLEAMPPAQRAQMEAAMKGRMGGAGTTAVPKIQYTKTGTDKVGKWTCDKYDGFVNGQKTAEVCAVDPKVLGFTASDFEISRQFAQFFKGMLPAAQAGSGQMFSIGTVADQGFAGVPVRHMFTLAGRQVTTEIVDVSRQNFPDSTFAVPEGFQKQAFPIAGRGRQ
jgi:hypothetical protein